MSNYKIRVNSKSESKEAQQLFFELGYNWFKKGYVEVKTPETIMSFENGALSTGIRGSINHKEITLPQLRDLVVLKRNKVGDATHKGSITDNVYYVSSDEEVYRFESSAWCFSTVIVADLKPIEKKEMKEYLDPENGYKLNLTDRPFFDWIEIPEGCNIITCENRKGNLVYFHWKSLDSDEFFLKDEKIWSNNFNETLSDFIEKNEGDVVIIWSRHTLPEELPFIDDECYTNKSDGGFSLPKSEPCDISNWVEIREEGSLNDQYAEIETVRKKIRENNHYFIDVSDVDEVDFYEIAKRYNVTDPAIQHILKKCLAIGNRGHKDLETDLMDILKTAKRALRINGFGEPK